MNGLFESKFESDVPISSEYIDQSAFLTAPQRGIEETSELSRFLLLVIQTNKNGARVKPAQSKAIPVSTIEAMYAMASMGRDRELELLLNLELPALRDKLSTTKSGANFVWHQQMVRQSHDYALEIELTRQGVQEHIQIALNVCSSAFMVLYQGKPYSLITAKSVCHLILQLLLANEPSGSYPLSLQIERLSNPQLHS